MTKKMCPFLKQKQNQEEKRFSKKRRREKGENITDKSEPNSNLISEFKPEYWRYSSQS